MQSKGWDQVQRELNILALIKGNERYVFVSTTTATPT